MSLTRNQTIIIGAGVVVVIVIVLILVGVLPGLQSPTDKPPAVTLTVWGIDDQPAFNALIDGYKKIRPNASVLYAQIPEASYEENLVNSLAAGTGPDVFMIPNGLIRKHGGKMLAAPANQLSLGMLRQLFPQVVEQNLVVQNQIYSLPLYLDTLALFYNKDIFDAKTISLPPQTWKDFQNIIPKIRENNESNQIVKAAAAIGGSKISIKSASDILNLLMMQFGNPKATTEESINFDDQGLQALNFYLQFANPVSPSYTWNDNLGSSIDNFSQGKTAMIFAYNGDAPLIKAKSPFLNFGIAAMPQFNLSQPVNQPNYWGLAVSRQTKKAVWAWDFIINTTTNQLIIENYIQIKDQSPGLRTLIQNYVNDPNLGVFVKQALTARAWPEPDHNLVGQSFSNGIASVLTGQVSPKQALDRITNEINALQ